MTTSLQRSEFDLNNAFELLHPGIQRWVYSQGWDELRDIQAAAIVAIVKGGQDVLISAPTAGGKTEAAFLPLLTRALQEERSGVRALYIGPLKALINDQFERILGLCEVLEIPVNAWHGDVSASSKERLRKAPAGVVLITPESLEALFVNHGSRVASMFLNLEAIVIDEVHSFIGSERGKQLQSLMHRIEAATKKRIDRIGLSATLGDPLIAAEFLRPGSGDDVQQIESASGAPSFRAQIVGIESPGEQGLPPPGLTTVANHLYSRMRGKNNLIFANARNRVETLGDLLVKRCEMEGVPVEFGAHHGSLSKDIRQEAEQRLKEGRPYTVVCTSTLEMGIDIGSMDSVAQIGVPPSVASLRQRLGRSGRRGKQPSTLWMYSLAKYLDQKAHLHDKLRVGLFQQAAMLELMGERWCEPPRDEALHLSTFVQQSLSAVAERGGIQPGALYHLLCKGAFRKVSKDTFLELLRELGQRKILVSAEDGTLLPGEVGERILGHYSFYSAFATPEEYRIICDGRTLGTLPIDHPVHPEGFIIFAAQRWKVVDIDDKGKTIHVKRAHTGKAPIFGSDGPFGTHREIRIRMKSLYESTILPRYLDATGQKLLSQARTEYESLRLGEHVLIREDSDVWLFLWQDDFVAVTLSELLIWKGLEASGDGFSLQLKDCSEDSAKVAIRELGNFNNWPSAQELASRIKNKSFEKHDYLLGEKLLALEYAAKMLDIEGARRAVTDLIRRLA